MLLLIELVGAIGLLLFGLKEVREGMECGILLSGFNDIKEGDLLEAFRINEVKRTLEESSN